MRPQELFGTGRWLWALLFVAVLAACATPDRIGRDDDEAFHRTGRFAVTVNTPSEPPEAVQGGFAWHDTGGVLTLDLANPLGNTLARVIVRDTMAQLTHSNGAQEYARDADGLVEQVLGSPVPVSGLRDWLRGRTGHAAVHELKQDDAGRPTGFVQHGWRVSLSRYDDLGPTVLQMNRRDGGRDIRVRLVVSSSPDSRKPV